MMSVLVSTVVSGVEGSFVYFGLNQCIHFVSMSILVSMTIIFDFQICFCVSQCFCLCYWLCPSRFICFTIT